MYDPNFQHKKGQEQGGGVVSQEGKLNMIRVKKLKFTLKGSNYEDAQNTAPSGGDLLTEDWLSLPVCVFLNGNFVTKGKTNGHVALFG